MQDTLALIYLVCSSYRARCIGAIYLVCSFYRARCIGADIFSS